MSCSSSSHAQHTFVRGCCTTLCPCPGVASYSAEKYCPCNETVGNITRNYGEQICNILGGISGFSGSYAQFSGVLSNLNFSQIMCGSFDIYVDTYVPKIATISNGSITLGAQIPFNPDIPYTVHVNNQSNPSCATITII
jgi:hypothetical protein